MPLIEWPPDLPQVPLRRGNSLEEPFQEPERDEMEAGNVRLENRYSTTVSRVAYTYSMTSEQLARFETFVRDELFRGTMTFMGPCWTTEGRMGQREMYFTRGNSYKASMREDAVDLHDVACDLSVIGR